jgi:hypothetical protein
MRHVSCDLCTKDLIAGKDARYTVTVDARLVCDPVPWPTAAAFDFDPDSDTDHIDAMDELLADLPDDDTVDEADEVPLPVAPLNKSFDLCGRCYRRFAAAPLGGAVRRDLSFSTN